MAEVKTFEDAEGYPREWVRLSFSVLDSMTLGEQEGVLVDCGSGYTGKVDDSNRLFVYEAEGQLVFVMTGSSA